MTEPEIRQAFLEELLRVAPDLDAATIAGSDHLQKDLELDSMDVLNLVAALHARLGVDIPEPDYVKIATSAQPCPVSAACPAIRSRNAVSSMGFVTMIAPSSGASAKSSAAA